MRGELGSPINGDPIWQRRQHRALLRLHRGLAPWSLGTPKAPPHTEALVRIFSIGPDLREPFPILRIRKLALDFGERIYTPRALVPEQEVGPIPLNFCLTDGLRHVPQLAVVESVFGRNLAIIGCIHQGMSDEAQRLSRIGLQTGHQFRAKPLGSRLVVKHWYDLGRIHLTPSFLRLAYCRAASGSCSPSC